LRVPGDCVRSQWRDPTGEHPAAIRQRKGDLMNPATASNAPAPAALPVLRFSTDQFRERDRVPAWRDFVGRTFCKTEIEPLSNEGFAGLTIMRMLPGLGIITGNCSPLTYTQTRQLSDSDDVILTAASGAWQLQRNGTSEAYGPGDAVLTSGAGVASYVLHSGGPHFGLRVPLKLLAPHIAGIEDMFGRRLPAQSPAMRLLRHYLAVITDLDAPGTQEPRALVAAHIRDLIALAVGATRDGAEIAGANGARAARLRAVKSDIVDHLGSLGLSVAEVAARQRLPVRYIQRLFEDAGTTFTDFVLGERLSRAHRMLTDARHAGRAVGTIAFDSGFGHLSYFNRTFRARYGAPPSDIRAQTRRAS
jgi:AraC-like DNA-binding protein